MDPLLKLGLELTNSVVPSDVLRQVVPPSGSPVAGDYCRGLFGKSTFPSDRAQQNSQNSMSGSETEEPHRSIRTPRRNTWRIKYSLHRGKT